MLVEADLDIPEALSQIESLLFDEQGLSAMSEASRSQGRTEVADQVAELLIARFDSAASS